MVTALGFVSVAAVAANGGMEVSELVEDEPVIWGGERIIFTKADGADPTLAENQDRITDNVWITRGNEGGQIYNAVERDSASKADSPLGTLWALGTTAELSELTFAPFRVAVGSPKQVPGKDLVLFLVEDRVFIDVRFRSWSQEKRGGFSYERSTPAD
jgi:hypothetical protein